MAGSFNDNVARDVKQGSISIVTTVWRPIVANTTVANGDSVGLAPMSGRRHVRYQIKAVAGYAMALGYGQKQVDGSFSQPVTTVKTSTIVPGNSTVVEPLGDSVQLYGKLVLKAGVSANSSARVIVTEYS